ncbi:hypothetical protein SDC9_137954 [bioreactor metagenome]|uniref:Uncharacterized protein n=1 Tax=bioreactor metagenome TaxID=1076179 RepID=A0A645DQS8_9ZZZZ
MRKLRSVGYDSIVVLGRRRDDAAKANRREEIRQHLLFISRLDQYHGGAFEKVRPGSAVAHLLNTCHRMPADKGEPVLQGGSPSRRANRPFCAAAVDNKGILRDKRPLFGKPLLGETRCEGHHNELAQGKP